MKEASLLNGPLWAGDFSGSVTPSKRSASARLLAHQNRKWLEAATINYEGPRWASHLHARGSVSFSSGTEILIHSMGARTVLQQKGTEFSGEIAGGFLYRHFRCGKILVAMPSAASVAIVIPWFRLEQTRARIDAFGVTLPLAFTGATPSDNDVAAEHQFFQGHLPKLVENFNSRLQGEIFVSACLWIWLQTQAAQVGRGV